MSGEETKAIFGANSVGKATLAARHAAEAARTRAPLERRHLEYSRRYAVLDNRIARSEAQIVVRPHAVAAVGLCAGVGCTVFLGGVADHVGYVPAAIAGSIAAFLAGALAIAGLWSGALYPRGTRPLFLVAPAAVLAITVGYFWWFWSAGQALLVAGTGLAVLCYILRGAWSEWRLAADRLEREAVRNELVMLEARLAPPGAATPVPVAVVRPPNHMNGTAPLASTKEAQS